MKKDTRTITNISTGTSWYRFQNISGADLMLPRAAFGGRTMIAKDQFFEGDEYFTGVHGVRLVANLTPVKPIVESTEVPEAKPQLLVDSPASSTLEFFEPSGEPIVEQKTVIIKEKSKLELTRKELMEYAEFKGIKLPQYMNREEMMETIRQQSKKQIEE